MISDKKERADNGKTQYSINQSIASVDNLLIIYIQGYRRQNDLSMIVGQLVVRSFVSEVVGVGNWHAICFL